MFFQSFSRSTDDNGKVEVITPPGNVMFIREVGILIASNTTKGCMNTFPTVGFILLPGKVKCWR